MSLFKFIVMDIETSSDPRDRALPIILAVPDDVESPEDHKAKELVLKAIIQNCPRRIWRWNRKCAFSENDAALSPTINSMFQNIDWNSVEHIWLNLPDNSSEAYDYVKLVGPAKSVENLIAKDTHSAYRYAMDILKGRFPEGEEAIGKDAIKSLNYADMAKCRVVSGEDLIAKMENLSFQYGKIMKKYDLWGSWSEDEVAKSPVWMYQYAKDHTKGPLPDSLHNKMHLLSFSEIECDKWLKKYLGAKKYKKK